MSKSKFRGLFRAGEKVQLTGPKGRLNTITLVSGGVFGTHRGNILHDEIIGKPDGSVISNENGIEYLALRPLLTDYVLSMPRGAAIVYPKDAANIITMGDIFPGAAVIEAGVGSGALSMYLLRAIGNEGRLTSIERREEFAEIAQANAATAFGQRPENWDVKIGDFQDVVDLEGNFWVYGVHKHEQVRTAPWRVRDGCVQSGQVRSSGSVRAPR